MICMEMRPRGRPCWHGGGINTGAAAPAAAHHCRAHARACMGFAGGPAGALDIESAQAAAGAIPRASAPRISENPHARLEAFRDLAWDAAKARMPPTAPTAGAGVVRCGKSHQPGLCRTRGISLIGFFNFHFMSIIRIRAIIRAFQT